MVCSARRGTRKVVIREKGGRRLLQGGRDLTDVLISPCRSLLGLYWCLLNSVWAAVNDFVEELRLSALGVVLLQSRVTLCTSSSGLIRTILENYSTNRRPMIV